MDEGMSGATAIEAQGGNPLGPVDIAQISKTVPKQRRRMHSAGDGLPRRENRLWFIRTTKKEDHHG
jgi:hypothetical protein